MTSSEAGPGKPVSSPDDMYSPVTMGRVSGLIVDQIRVLIRDGMLTAGDRLPSERELGERFGVSRVTVREALRGLEANGLVTIRVGARGGAFVTAPTSERVGEGITDLLTLSGLSAAEVTEARQVFEMGCVPLVCERADEQDIADLLEICDHAEEALESGKYPVALSAEFHVRVARASHNAAIEMLAQSFHGPMVMSLQQAQDQDPKLGVLGTQEHRRFVKAVRKRDVPAAEAVMSKHLARTAARVKSSGKAPAKKSSTAKKGGR